MRVCGHPKQRHLLAGAAEGLHLRGREVPSAGERDGGRRALVAVLAHGGRHDACRVAAVPVIPMRLHMDVPRDEGAEAPAAAKLRGEGWRAGLQREGPSAARGVRPEEERPALEGDRRGAAAGGTLVVPEGCDVEELGARAEVGIPPIAAIVALVGGVLHDAHAHLAAHLRHELAVAPVVEARDEQAVRGRASAGVAERRDVPLAAPEGDQGDAVL
mmetsp:Transcript_122716/g.382057  ORF Transcript_122716/g.382057 Transcript_122716/m.382057 type:complete len:216 (-) Transcript_122716:476-1123(-)